MELNAEQKARYRRHLALKEVGEAGQIKLLASRVLLVGGGGLGSPAALYLAAAGVGRIGLADGDVIDLSNLNRQILYTTAELGRVKVAQAKEKLEALNPDIQVTAYHCRLDAENAEAICRDYQVVVDCLDNFAARFVLNDVCLKLNIPLVHAGVYKYYGQTLTILPGQGACLRCLYPEGADLDKTEHNCGNDGILGVIPGVLGTLQALETLKLLLNLGESNSRNMLYFDGLNLSFDQIKVEPRADCPCRKIRPAVG